MNVPRAAFPFVLALLAIALSPAALAEPEPLSVEARRRAERAFFFGRFEDVDAILGASNAPIDRELPEILHRYWRSDDRTSLPVEGTSVSSRRIRWTHAWHALPVAEYFGPAADEAEPYPLLTALVLDRLRRETKGIAGLAAESPLAALRDEAAQALLDRKRFAYEGPEPSAHAPAAADPEAQLAARTTAIARRNALVAAAAGIAFLALSLLLARRLGRSTT
jgi:hypothetical protein